MSYRAGVPVLGLDLGVRSLHAALIRTDGSLFVETFACLRPKAVAAQGPYERARELHELADYTWVWAKGFSTRDLVVIEEPPLAGTRNVRTLLKLAQVSAAAAVGAGHCPRTFVPVDTWKKAVIGRGGVSKEYVANWLKLHYPTYYRQCAGDQNLIDATCLALYGRATAPGGLDYQQPALAAG